MTILDKVITGKQAGAARKILLYGQEGVGKSTFGANAPKPIFIQTEDGLKGIDCDKFPLCMKYDQVLENIKALIDEKHEYKTLVIDSLDWLEKIIHARVCKDEAVKVVSAVGFQKGFDYAEQYWEDLLLGYLIRLQDVKNMHIILIAHSEDKIHKPSYADSYERCQPKLHKKANALVCEWADEILFATKKVLTKEVKESHGSVRKRAIGDGDRVIYTSSDTGKLAKNRLDNIPEEIPLSWNEYAKYLPKEPIKTETKTNG